MSPRISAVYAIGRDGVKVRQEHAVPVSEARMTRGRIAYAAYCKAAGGKSLVSGESLPTFDQQRPEIQLAWVAAAAAVAQHTIFGASEDDIESFADGHPI